MKLVLSSGHGKKIRGASGSPVPPQLDEVDEARRVVERVADFLRSADVGVDTYHDDVSTTQNENLNRIVDYHNSRTRDLDCSIHFNAFDHSAHGTECLYVTQETMAGVIASKVAAAGHVTNRGAKYRSDLFFLNNTAQPAVLVETVFCDNTNDSNLYREHFDDICRAIAEGLTGKSIPSEQPPARPERPGRPADEAVVDITTDGNLTIVINDATIESASGDAKVEMTTSGPVTVKINGATIVSGGGLG